MSTHHVKITINGKVHEADVESRLLLVHFLRENLNMTGTHIGCDTTSCGACTVQMNGTPVKSCTVLAVQADGMDIKTIEGLAENGKLHPIQEAFIQAGAVQCGYCTCGMIMSAKSFLSHHHSPSEQQIREGIAGNLCRCTGYQKIVDAVKMASENKHFTARI